MPVVIIIASALIAFLEVNTYYKQLLKEQNDAGWSCLSKYRWLLEEKEKTLEIDIGEVRFTGDPAFLEKDWEYLFSNALKYTEIGGAIEVVFSERIDWAKVLIQDNGIGIDEEGLVRIFDRFYWAMVG